MECIYLNQYPGYDDKRYLIKQKNLTWNLCSATILVLNNEVSFYHSNIINNVLLTAVQWHFNI
jgi:hypothetical protein